MHTKPTSDIRQPWEQQTFYPANYKGGISFPKGSYSLTCWSMSTNPERVKLGALPNLGDVSHWKSAWLSAPRRHLRCGHNKHKPAPFAPRSCSNGHPSRRLRSHPKPRLSSNSVRLAKSVHTSYISENGGHNFLCTKTAHLLHILIRYQ